MGVVSAARAAGRLAWSARLVASTIPTRSREIVMARDRRCIRCGATGPVQWHHRRSRRVRDAHVHCAGNGVLLCPTCHAHVHAHVTESIERGLIVSAYIDEPETIPVKTYRGWVTHDHDGNRAAFPGRR